MEIEGWVFDLDGVLVDSERLHMEAWIEAVRRRGGTLGWEWLPRGIGKSDATFWQLAAPEIGLDPADASIIQDKAEILSAIIEDRGVPPCPGAEALLRFVGERWPVGLATSSSRAYLDSVLERHGWADAFRFTLSRDEVKNLKPDPEIYLAAAAGLGAGPRRCVAVEDSPPGLTAARAAGMTAVGVTTNFPPERLDQADLIVDSLEEDERIFVFLGI